MQNDGSNIYSDDLTTEPVLEVCRLLGWTSANKFRSPTLPQYFKGHLQGIAKHRKGGHDRSPIIFAWNRAPAFCRFLTEEHNIHILK